MDFFAPKRRAVMDRKLTIMPGFISSSAGLRLSNAIAGHNGHACSSSFRGASVANTKVARHGVVAMCQPVGGQKNESKRMPPQREMKPAMKELRSVLKKCSIYLIGPMGSGKSALGKYLAYELDFRFLDTDDLIESAAKKSIPRIFEEDGEEAFRDWEAAILDQVQPFIGCCVSTGGGIVLRRTNWGKLHTGIVIFLDVAVDVLVERLKGDTNRPLLANADDLEAKISSILEERRELYEQADVIIPVEKNEALDELGIEVVRRLTNFIKANPPRLSKLYPGGIQ